MQKKLLLKRLGGCLFTLVLLLAAINWLSGLMMRKDSQSKFQEFYAQEENFDVLFLGSSHVWNGVAPLDLWEQNGIVSYNLATSGSRIATSYWVLRNALEYTEPRLVVVDGCYLLDEKTNSNVNYNHRAFDSMPFGPLKIQAITDLYEEEEDVQRYLFPFALYHNRWDELTDKDFHVAVDWGMMGFAPLTDVTPVELPELMPEAVEPIDNASTQYLEKIITLCQERGIEVAIMMVPFSVSETSRNDAGFLQTIADQYGIDYLNPMELAACIDQRIDFHNDMSDNSHLNFSGAHKLSYFLGNYIAQNYDIPDRREDPAYAQWHDYYDLYAEQKVSILKRQKNADSYLSCAADRNYSCLIQLCSGDVLQDEVILSLLENLGVDPALITDTTGCLFIQAGGEAVFYGDGSTVLAEAGEFTLADDNIYLEGAEFARWDKPAEEDEIRILVMEQDTLKILDDACFTLERDE